MNVIEECYGKLFDCYNGNLVCAPGGYTDYCCDNTQCNDNNRGYPPAQSCTTDTCSNNICDHQAVPDNTPSGTPGYVCCGGQEYQANAGVCCDGNWIGGGECCSDDDCASKSCDNGVNPKCNINTHLCDCPPCKYSSDCANPTDCCAYKVDPSRGDCVPEGTIIGNYLCDRPE